MKRRRRIEVRTFRRRTTVILNGKQAGGHVGLPPHQADAPYTVAADSPWTERAEPEEPQTMRLPPGSPPLYIKRKGTNEE